VTLAAASGLHNPAHLLELAVLVVVYVLPAYLIARVAERRGHSFGGFLLGGLVVGWPFSGIIVVLAGRRPPLGR
jgi:hypothetical protein